ncbi:LLM class flavin-dependent oxidoreductase [Streptomyces spiramenti]|uniref:LLM class flavin-dependent oxidoreductase n=1 Tax=Streptomyces spiramenti TaxID=2720606 RepID=A0ABX1ALC7_9ACTN|nr:LLM class flavin-dependent oxidoreductase [Streptomyces spiramenti]NJP66193.1 LLM class flavin-dependent oxidoreductase [Streptomyces spiramenti]
MTRPLEDAPAHAAPQPRIGLLLPRDLPAGEVLDYARRAQDAGFTSLWAVEDMSWRGGVAQAAAVLATTRLEVGIGILPAGARNAVYAAMEVATLSQLFPGRLTVGVGHGMPAWMRAAGAWSTGPLGVLSDHVTAVRSLLRGGSPVMAEGGPAVALDPSALPDRVPDVLLGVRGPRSLALSGRIADGTVLAEPSSPEYVRAALAAVGAAGPHRLVAFNVASVDADRGRALERARPALAWIGEPDWAPHLAPMDIGEEVRALRERCADREEFARRLPDGWVARLALAGTPTEVRSGLSALAAAGVTDAVLLPTGPDPSAEVASLAAVV